ncbi:Glu/Leu/Phe/Val dehydrogenase [Paraneptunicella aestuarii]|uniref:Leu/Phe/Val dehydrogenase n=1 Tax=Paraneptunicella aestuarii TaxID=2831148 RepID=UPI001E3A5806|nr:Glu/Leu/Phe/Val dehydrogenase dimerization domain-containing protein [Paraneptunicella aestuarii]UAA37782.1 Glu/Leu/Phe/Val dehydrogenase [Paraneptunicella aestuarii]
MSLFEHHEFDNHKEVVFCNDEKSGLKAIIAVHNTNLGPSLGGCRMFPYANSGEALTDVLRLSKGMTYKAAMANLNQGGGKAVIIGDPRTQKSRDMFLALGDFIERLGGDYITAEDSGVAVSDLHATAERTQYVSGIKAKFTYDGSPADGNPAPGTAYGVFVGLKTTVEYALHSSLDGVKVAIQGLGHVGYRLAKHLRDAGAELYVTDIFPEQLEKAREELGATVVQPNDIYGLDVDVFAPCALGAILNDNTIPQIKAKVIAGAANNQLAREALGSVLRSKGICYAPDYVINAGGIIDIYHQTQDGTPDDLRKHLESIGDTLREIYIRADETDQANNLVANVIAEERFNK